MHFQLKNYSKSSILCRSRGERCGHIREISSKLSIV